MNDGSVRRSIQEQSGREVVAARSELLAKVEMRAART